MRELVRSRPAVIALCQADDELVNHLMATLDLKKHDYRERVMNGSAGRSRWDLVLLFDRRQVDVRRQNPIIARDGGLQLRAAYPLKIAMLREEQGFDLFLVHWPSRLRGGAEQRKTCATALRRAIERRLRLGTRVVVLGDLNEEPHDPLISLDLRASRDPEVVLGKPADRLYNPSWWLSSPVLGNAWQDFGTMFYRKSNSATRWHALDQALTCHQWLDREVGWAPELRALRPIPVVKSPQMFDHVPIELTLTR